MPPSPKPRRRWFRFSLRTLFVVVTVAAVLMKLSQSNPLVVELLFIAAILLAAQEILIAAWEAFERWVWPDTR